jgi:hypothetical protein
MVGWLGLGAALATAQEPRVIRPSPAYYQQQGLPVPAEAPAVAVPAAPVAPVAVSPAAAAAPQPVLSRPAPAAPAAPRPARALDRPAAPMTPLPVQPRPIAPSAAPRPAAAAASAAPMTPLPVQPRPVQAVDRPAAPMTPLAVQPRPVAPTPPLVQPVPTARTAAPVTAPVPVPPVQTAPVAAPPARPVPPDVVLFPAAPAYEEPEYNEPVYDDTPGTRISLRDVPEARDDWDGTSGYEWPGLSLGPKIGTTGLGLDLTFGVTRFLNLRSGFNYGSFTMNTDWGDVEYDTELDMTSIPLLVDWYPAGGHFRITGGFFIQPGTQADIDATPTKPVQIGSHTYGPDVIGTLSGKIEVDNTFAPYLGIGFGNTVGRDRRLTFSLDLGVIFQAYDVSLTSDGPGMTAKLDLFREDIQKEEEKIQDDLDDFKFYPVLTLGFGYHF